jgi:hypothetical protein
MMAGSIFMSRKTLAEELCVQVLLLGSTGRWPVAFGSLPNALKQLARSLPTRSRQAAANHKLAACVPQNYATLPLEISLVLGICDLVL